MQTVVLTSEEIEVLKFVVETFAKASLEAAEYALEEAGGVTDDNVTAALTDADAMRTLHERLSSAEDEVEIILNDTRQRVRG